MKRILTGKGKDSTETLNRYQCLAISTSQVTSGTVCITRFTIVSP